MNLARRRNTVQQQWDTQRHETPNSNIYSISTFKQQQSFSLHENVRMLLDTARSQMKKSDIEGVKAGA